MGVWNVATHFIHNKKHAEQCCYLCASIDGECELETTDISLPRSAADVDNCSVCGNNECILCINYIHVNYKYRLHYNHE